MNYKMREMIIHYKKNNGALKGKKPRPIGPRRWRRPKMRPTSGFRPKMARAKMARAKMARSKMARANMARSKMARSKMARAKMARPKMPTARGSEKKIQKIY